MHWKSSLLPISSQDNKTTNKDCKVDKNIAINGSDSSSIEIPYNGLYGFILGKRKSQSKSRSSEVDNGSSSSTVNRMTNFEARILNEQTLKAFTTCTDTGDAGVNASNHAKKMNTSKLKLSKQMKKMPLYCGCTFQATFYRSSTDEQIDIPRKKSIMIPFTSQIVDPLKCNMSKESSDVELLKVVSSPNVARMISVKKDTTVTLEYVKHCDRDDCDISSWEWGLISHCISIPKQQKNDNDDSANNIVKNQDKDMNDKPIQLPHEKRARYENDIDDYDDDGTFVDFFPKEASKKPLLCSICSRKFPNTDGIYKHCIIAHIDTIAIKGSQEYIDLVGPPIIRKPLHAAYEDDHLVVVVKHQGLIVQGDKWTLGKSDLLMPFRCKDKNITDALSKPRAVHRLDGATGGLLVVAKTHSSEVALKKCFAERLCRKRYRAIVFGRLEGAIIDDKDMGGGDGVDAPSTKADIVYKDDYLARGIINSPIGGKESTTYYYVVSYTRCPHESANGWISTVDLFPVSGRQHQLRRHMKLVGYPIFGDRRYGPYEKTHVNHDAIIEEDQMDDCRTVTDHPHSKLCLWALEIDFNHPVTEESVNVKIEEPQWYKDLRHDQDKKWCHSQRQG